MVARASAYVALLACLALPGLGTLGPWEGTSHGGWPGIGFAAVLLLEASTRGTRAVAWVLAAQTVGVGAVLATTYGVAWWLGALGSLAVTLPALVTARWTRPGTPAFRRFNEGEVDVYHGVTALSGLLCGVLSAVAALGDPGASRDVGHVLLTGLIAFVAATTAQLIVVPFWLRRAGGFRWRDLDHRLESWAQRLMLVLFVALIFVPYDAPPVGFLMFPILGWAAIRATSPETHLQVALVAVAAFAATVSGRGPLALGSLAAAGPFSPLLVYLYIASICYLLVPLALTVERFVSMTRQATRAASTVRRMLDSATGTVFIATDPVGTITHYSLGAQRVLGFRPDEVVGRDSSSLHTSAEVRRQARALGLAPLAGPLGDHVETYRRIAAEQIATGTRADWEFRHRDGGSRMVSLNISAMTENGQVLGFIASGEDSTERVRTQQALEQALAHERASVEALRETDQVKQELVSTVSHELRTPITNIVGFTELLLDDELGELSGPHRGAIERIRRNSGRLHYLVDDLLTLATLDADTPPEAEEVVDLNEVVTAAGDQLALQLRERSLDVTVAASPRPLVVRGHRALLERAVVNVWANAIKFTPDGGRVEVTVHGDPAAGTAHVTVRDTGIGIPASDHDAVFDRFYRSAVAGEQAIQGTGLGLSIVKSIVEQHRGSARVASTPGAGTTVTLTLPRHLPAADASRPATPVGVPAAP